MSALVITSILCAALVLAILIGTIRKVDGTWYIEHWYFEPVASLAQLNTSAEISKGFTGDSRFDIYPKPFELLTEITQ